MVHHPHLEQVAAAGVVEILVGGNVVADVVTSLPASKQGEPGRKKEGGGGEEGRVEGGKLRRKQEREYI